MAGLLRRPTTESLSGQWATTSLREAVPGARRWGLRPLQLFASLQFRVAMLRSVEAMIEQKHLTTYLELFCHRRDLYARQTRRGAYFLTRSPVSEQVVADPCEAA